MTSLDVEISSLVPNGGHLGFLDFYKSSKNLQNWPKSNLSQQENNFKNDKNVKVTAIEFYVIKLKQENS